MALKLKVKLPLVPKGVFDLPLTPLELKERLEKHYNAMYYIMVIMHLKLFVILLGVRVVDKALFKMQQRRDGCFCNG